MRSCSPSVLVYESAERVTPVHLGRRILATEGRFDSWIRRLQPERPMRAMGVVVLGVDPQHLLKVAVADNQQPVQALGADRPDPALGIGVGVGCLHRRDEHLDTLGAEHVVEAAGELRVTIAQYIAQYKAEPASLLLQHQQQVAGLLGDPAAVRVGAWGARSQ
jgi:hypothetical protein